MRYIWLTFLGLAALVGLLGWLLRPVRPAPASLAAAATPAALVSASGAAPAGRLRLPGRAAANPLADSLVQFALRQLGTPYRWAGTTPEGGFDCSGFLMYAYAHVGVPVPHSTALLIDAGQPVPRAEARPGDLVVFTGTALTSTTPGHAGIVVSAPGEVPLRFVHSSSARRESGVKISQVEGSDYERRFMQVRRVLTGEQLSSKELSRLAQTAPARRRVVAAVSPADARPPAVQVADETEPVRPTGLKSARRRPAAPRAAAAKPVTARATKAKARRTAAKVTPKSASRRAAEASPKRQVKPRKATAKTRRKSKARATSGRQR